LSISVSGGFSTQATSENHRKPENMETGKPMSLFQETSWGDKVQKPTKPTKTCETLEGLVMIYIQYNLYI